jgi:hypothetical protein
MGGIMNAYVHDYALRAPSGFSDYMRPAIDWQQYEIAGYLRVHAR